MFVIPANGVAQVRIYSVLDMQLAINVLYLGVPSSATSGVQSDTMLTAIDSVIPASYVGLMSSSAHLRGFSVQQVSPGPASDIEYLSDILAGTVSGNPLPKQVTGLLRLLTAAGGSAGKGRLYIPYPGDSNNGAAVPDGTYQTNLATFASILTTPLSVPAVGGGTASCNWAVFSKAFNTYNPINGTQVMPFWATQRKRGDFGKINVSPI